MPFLHYLQVALGSQEEVVCVDGRGLPSSRAQDLEVARGYGRPGAHNLSALAAAAGGGGGGCNRTALRRIGADLVPADVEVGAVRVSVTGWEGWVMEGLAVRSSHPPLLNFCVTAVVADGLG